MHILMISLKQINNKVVKPIPIPSHFDKRPIKGYQIIPEIYSNIFITAKKNKGKTSCLFKIMKECSDKNNTKIIIFASTIHKDEAWIEIVKYFEEKGFDIITFTSIYDDGIDQLQKLIDELSNQAEEEEINEDEEKEILEIDRCDDILNRLQNMHLLSLGQKISLPEEEQEEKKKVRKSKYRSNEYLIIFDDLSNELKNKSLETLLKKNRHYKSKVIISTQWPNDSPPSARKQGDVFIVFSGFTKKKMEDSIYKDCDTSLDFELFYKLYRKATKKEHSFLYIDSRKDEFRQNFNKQFIIKPEEEPE